MKILLVAPPWLDIYGDFKEAAKLGCASPPLGLMYLGASIRESGSRCRILDMESQDFSAERLLDVVGEYDPDMVGLTATTPVFGNAVHLARLISDRYPNKTLCLGGVHSTVVGKEALEQCPDLDFQVVGEGERPIQAAIAALEAGKSLEGVEGIIFRNHGKVVENPRQRLVENLDSFPLPARDLVDSSLYTYSVPGKKGFVEYATIFTSRGCPFQCIFCSQHTMFGRRMRWFSIERVIEELKYVVRTQGIQHVIVMDETLTLIRKRTLELCKAIREEGLEFTWEGWTHASTIDEELLREMKATGLVRLSFGIESGDPKILEIIKKNVTLDQIRTAYKIAARVGIETRGSAMLGHPHETRKTAWNTLKFLRSIPELKQIFLNVACPYPGTELFDYASTGRGGMRLLTTDYSKYKRYGDPVIEVNDLSFKDLRRLQMMGLLYFYLTPDRMWYNVVKTGRIQGRFGQRMGFRPGSNGQNAPARPMTGKMFFLRIVVAASILTGLCLYVSPHKVLENLACMDGTLLAVMLALMPVFIAVRIAKWIFLVRQVNSAIAVTELTSHYFRGMLVGLITPLRLGEVTRALFIGDRSVQVTLFF